MAVPVTAKTLDDLLLSVARKLSISNFRADGTPYLPVTDAFNLNECVDIVNRGLEIFIDAAPPEGWRWERRVLSVTLDPTGLGVNNVAADPARYMLPLDFGGEVRGKIRYAANTAHATQIDWVDEATIRLRRVPTVMTSYPNAAAIRPYQPTTTVIASGRRWELFLDPQPVAADTLEFPYLVHFDGARMQGGIAASGSTTNIVSTLFATNFPSDDTFNGWYVEIVNGAGRGSYATVTNYTGLTGTFTVADWLKSDGSAAGADPGASSEFLVKPAMPYYHPMGFAYDGCIEVACLAACELWGGDQIFDTHHTDMWLKMKMPQAHLINRRQVPAKIGRMTDGPHEVPERTWKDVVTSHDM